MVKNNKLIETVFECVKRNGVCKGCFYGDGNDMPSCMFHMMNDVLFLFNNPVPQSTAHVLTLEEVEDTLSDRKDHLAFAEFISSIHVAKPVIRTVKMSGNFITLFDPTTNESDTFNKAEYYTSFRIWSSKPTDKLRNETQWTPMDGHAYDEEPAQNLSKTATLLKRAYSMTQNTPNA